MNEQAFTLIHSAGKKLPSYVLSPITIIRTFRFKRCISIDEKINMPIYCMIGMQVLMESMRCMIWTAIVCPLLHSE